MAHPTPDLADFDAQMKTGGSRLKVDVLIEEVFTPEQVASLWEAVQRGYPGSVIARVLSGWAGQNVSETAVRLWLSRQT